MLHMQADLMGPSGLQPAQHHGKASKPFQHLILRNGFASAFRNHSHPFPVIFVPVHAGFNQAPVGFYIAADNAQVRPLRRFVLNLFGQGYMGVVVLRDNHDAAGILIQPVHDAGTDHAVDPRQIPAVKQQRIDQRACVMPRRRVHHHAPGFVKHDHIVVFIDDVQRNIFRLRLQRHRPGQYYLKNISCLNFIVWLDLLISFADAAFIQQYLNMGAGTFQDFSKKHIRPLSGISCVRSHFP